MASGSYTSTTDLTKVFTSVRSITVAETSGSATVRVQLRDGADSTNDPVMFSIGATAGGSSTHSFPANKPLRCPSGVRLEIISGAGRITITGS